MQRISLKGLPRLEQENRNLAKVEVDEVLCLMRDVGAEVAADDSMPCWIVLLVEFLLDEGGDIFLDVVLLKCLSSTVNGILLHVLGHVGVLDDSLAIAHGSKCTA